MRRRDLLKLGAASLVVPAPIIRSAWAQDDAIQFCAPNPMSGGFAANGKYADLGMKLLIEQTGSLLDRPLRYTTLDTEGKPATAVRRTQEAFEQKHARFFAGGILSSEALAMGKELNRLGGIFVTTAGADELTGSDCNNATFRWSVPTFGAIEQTVRPLIEQYPDAKRWFTITPQYVFGEGLLNAAKNIFEEKGLEHVGNAYHSLDEREFSGYLTNAAAAKPDVLLILNFGSQSSDTLRQAVSFGIKDQMTILVAWASGLEQFETLGADLCEDVYFGAQYWHGIDTDFNKNLVSACRDAYGENPNYSLAGAYISTHMMVEGIKKAESTDTDEVIAAMEGADYDGLTGKEHIRKEDHQVLKDYYLLKGKAKADMEDDDDYAEILSSGQSFLDPQDAQCDMS